MGCTSSAPGSLTPSSAYGKAGAVAEDSLRIPDELHSDTVETKEIKRCDNFVNAVAAVDSSPIDASTEQSSEDLIDSQKDMTPEPVTVAKVAANPDDMFNDQVLPGPPTPTPAGPDPPGPDPLPTLEDVVEKVVELYIHEAGEKAQDATRDEEEEEVAESREPLPEDVEEDDGDSSAGVSPSRSCSSRATRWEALADVAAELPASLAVDPLTGQIYSK